VIFAMALSVAAIWILSVVWVRSTAAAAQAQGSLNVQSDPAGASVFIDDRPSGTTPVSLTLPSGIHRLVVRENGRSQELAVTISHNVSIVHHFTWPSESRVMTNGNLRVTAEGATAIVSVDNVRRGSTPVTVSGLSEGDHDVIVVRSGNTYHRTIHVDAGATASLVIGATDSAGPQSGWLAASAATPLQILEDGKLVGSTASERILMPAGDHVFEFVNPALGFQVSRRVKILTGRTQSVAIDLPQAQISINATPWARVWLDERSVGETPIGNLTTTIGSHEVVLRHPQFGERRITAVVTLTETARVAVDMRRSQ
jgi:hypothetical protein